MKRKLALLLATALGLSATVFTPAPAQATTIMWCSGMYSIELDQSYYYGLLGPAKHTDYTIRPVTVTCHGLDGVLTLAPDIHGTFDGTCLLAQGHAESSGHTADALWVGDKMVFRSGGGIGQSLGGNLVFHPDATRGESCTDGGQGARYFIAVGHVFYV